jgi:hypothetical protein
MVLTANRDYFLNSVSKLIVLMVKCGVLFEVWAEFLSTIWKSFSFINFFTPYSYLYFKLDVEGITVKSWKIFYTKFMLTKFIFF